jgi:hypothetical protein
MWNKAGKACEDTILALIWSGYGKYENYYYNN